MVAAEVAVVLELAVVVAPVPVLRRGRRRGSARGGCSTGRSKPPPFHDTSCGVCLSMRSKKRRISSGSASSALADRRDLEAGAVAQRAARSRPRCWKCSGRKSLPVCCAPLLDEPVEHGGVVEVGAARSWTRRRPATSGTVSMSKTRIGVMAAATPALSREHAGRQVAVAAVADDEHDRRVLDLARDRAAPPRRRRRREMPQKMPSSRARRRVVSSASACVTGLDAVDARARRRSSAGTPRGHLRMPGNLRALGRLRADDRDRRDSSP